MMRQELIESILEWANKQTEPFVTSYVFGNIEEAENIKEVSDSLRKLFIDGHLARKKIDNVRYAYIVSKIAPFDFEKCWPGKDQSSSEPVQVFVKTAQKIQKTDKKRLKDHPSDQPSESKNSTIPESDVKKEQFPAYLPDNFTLTLQTPGGLIITIASGANNGSAQ